MTFAECAVLDEWPTSATTTRPPAGMDYSSVASSVFGANTAPHWLTSAHSRIARLMNLQANWNTYGARPIQFHVATAAFDLLCQIADSKTPSPAIVPTSDGKLQIEWHQGGFDLEVRVDSRSSFSFSFEDAYSDAAPIEDEPLKYDFTPLRKAVDKLSQRLNEGALRG